MAKRDNHLDYQSLEKVRLSLEKKATLGIASGVATVTVVMTLRSWITNSYSLDKSNLITALDTNILLPSFFVISCVTAILLIVLIVLAMRASKKTTPKIKVLGNFLSLSRFLIFTVALIVLGFRGVPLALALLRAEVLYLNSIRIVFEQYLLILGTIWTICHVCFLFLTRSTLK